MGGVKKFSCATNGRAILNLVPQRYLRASTLLIFLGKHKCLFLKSVRALRVVLRATPLTRVANARRPLYSSGTCRRPRSVSTLPAASAAGAEHQPLARTPSRLLRRHTSLCMRRCLNRCGPTEALTIVKYRKVEHECGACDERLCSLPRIHHLQGGPRGHTPLTDTVRGTIRGDWDTGHLLLSLFLGNGGTRDDPW